MKSVIDALVTGRPGTFPLDIPNAGQCADLAPDVVAESMCVVLRRTPSQPRRSVRESMGPV